MRLIYWLLSFFGWPRPVSHLKVHIMATSVQLTWQDPVKLTEVEIGMRVQGAPTFTIINSVPAGAQALLVPDLDEGTYEFEVTAINGTKRGPAVQASISLFSVPAAVTALAVTEV